MKIKFRYLFLILFTLSFSFAQEKDEVLLKVDGEPIMTSEFLRVYNKNLDLVKDESQKDVDGYLKLFTEYQLKLKEAKRLKYNEDTKYQREFLRYKKQLTKNYLSENKVTDALVEEAYKRSNMDVKACHVLVRLDENSKDTIDAYNKVLKLRDRLQKEGFAALKKEVHDGASIFVEDLGYFSAFKMVYDFETAAYNTPKGEISMPFRTQFGYHVVKVNEKRPSRGTINASHIMVALEQKDSLLDPEERINDIYKKIQQGENFESLAKQFSEDKSSASKGGQLTAFKSGQLSSVKFEDEAFALINDGDTSKPFKTQYGWHIIKRNSLKPIQSFEDLKPSLESRVKRDTRSKLINAAMKDELKKRYQISYNPKAKAYFEPLLSNDYFVRSWRLPEDFEKEAEMFKINDRSYTYNEFGRHLMSAQRLYVNKSVPFSTVIDKEFDAFFEKSILQYREDNLELENKEFADILKEYRDGLLLFDLMEKEVWNKASKDTLGLENYHKKHQSKYQWTDRVDAVIVSSANKKMVEKASKMMKKRETEEHINDALNTESEKNIIFTKGTFALSDVKLPSNFKAKSGLSKVYKHNEAYHVIDVKKVLPAGSKTLEEAKGSVISDYQAEIEANWIEGLHKRFKIEVNDKALKNVKKRIKNQ